METIKTDAIKLKNFALPREAFIGWVSSLMEAYNMAVYGFTAPFLAKAIFQELTPEHALLFSYGLMFVGACILYPAGAVYYGLIGDNEGRQKTCTYSTLGLALATGCMGLVPFHGFGNLSWICFLFLLGGQYFFAGGEYHGSIVFALEHTKKEQSGLMSGMSCLFAVIGLLMANGFATVSVTAQNETWVRCCFFIGALGGLVSYILKKYCQETPEFLALSKNSMQPAQLLPFIQSQWRSIGGVIIVLALFLTIYPFIFIFLPLVNIENTPYQSFDTFKSLIAYGLILVLAGIIADRVGVQKIIKIGAGALAFLILPACYFCSTLFTLQLFLTAFACLVIGPIHSWMLHEFEVQHRCKGIFISSAIAVAVFGASTVPICLMLLERFHSLVICSIYPMLIAAIAFFYFIFKPQREFI